MKKRLSIIQRTVIKCVSLLMLIGGMPAYATHTQAFQLQNGLKILVRVDHRSPIVVSQIWYKVGSSYEHDGITGISHVLEHMMFKGTRHYPPGEFSRIISENGGRNNAFTGTDYTAYYQVLERSRLEIALRLEANRMRDLLLEEALFEKELAVVKEERRLRTEDNPQAYTHERAMAVAFQTSPYRHPIIGWASDLDQLSTGSLKEWYQGWYAPNNATLVVAGDVDPDVVAALAKKHFGPIAATGITKHNSRPEVPQSGIKRLKVKRPARLPYLMMIYKVPSLRKAITSEDTEAWEIYALEVLTSVLDGGNSARFTSRLVRDREIAVGVSARYWVTARLNTSTLVLSGTPAAGRLVDELELAFRQELIDLKTRQISDDELSRVKAQVVAENVYEKDSVFYQAMTLGLLDTIGLDWRLEGQYVDKINAVTAEQVLAVAKKYLVDDHLTIAELEPLPLQGKQPTTSGIDAIHAH